MSVPHPEDHEALVMELLTGSKDADDAGVKARLDGCPTCRDRVAELREVVTELTITPSEREALLVDAAAPVAGEDEALDRWRQTLAAGRFVSGAHSGAANRPTAPARRPAVLRNSPAMALAASLLIALSIGAWWIQRPEPTPDLPPIELDAAAFADAVPSGAQATRVDRFSWRESGVPSRAWQVELLAAEPEGGALADPPFLVSPRLIEPEWRPTAAEAALLPASFRWRIVAEDARGLQRRSAALAVTQPPSTDRGR